MTRALKCVLGLILCAQLSGCALLLVGAATGGGTALWLSGKLQREFEVSLDRALTATEQALRLMRLTVVKTTVKDNVAQLIVAYSDGRKVWIDIHEMTPAVSKIQIRVGAMGDEQSARKIMNQIAKLL